ncbi:hypothetical protein RRG08_024308 [Elysia crispata]|uniref:Uncharacterized protein n=1 Tax=Elysia crispata TaxID=231223 RepID=A0AAE1A356_9GAST|nr:hypothetical protein RRG08_024308 [Elysia crispata]
MLHCGKTSQLLSSVVERPPSRPQKIVLRGPRQSIDTEHPVPLRYKHFDWGLVDEHTGKRHNEFIPSPQDTDLLHEASPTPILLFVTAALYTSYTMPSRDKSQP